MVTWESHGFSLGGPAMLGSKSDAESLLLFFASHPRISASFLPPRTLGTNCPIGIFRSPDPLYLKAQNWEETEELNKR